MNTKPTKRRKRDVSSPCLEFGTASKECLAAMEARIDAAMSMATSARPTI